MALINGMIDSLYLPKEMDDKLVEEFPNLYRARYTTNHGLRWGFKIQPGWFPLIENLSKKLEEEILKYPEDERERYYALQVKQKFAGLAFYTAAATEEMDEMISQAEMASFTICEMCGKNGASFWPNQPKHMERIFTLCPEHKEAADKVRGQ
jgi:hypothetical protein